MERSELRVGFSGVEEALREDGICSALTSGGSMAPLFKTHRDIVVVERLSDSPKKYDVVLYKIGENFVLHRIIGYKKETDEYIVRGDNTYVREYIKSERIIARLCAFRRKGNYKTVDSRSFKIYSRVWNFIYPIRFILHKFRMILFRIKHAIFK